MNRDMANTQTTANAELLTTAQVATALQVHPETVRRLIKSGALKGIRWAETGRFRVPRVELNRFLQAGQQ